MKRLLLPSVLCAVLLGLLSARGTARAQPDGAEDDPPPRAPPGYVAVPDVRRLPPDQAARRLVDALLNPGQVYEAVFPDGWQLGVVVQQAPAPSTPENPRYLPIGGQVALRVSAEVDGPPEGRPPPRSWPRIRVSGEGEVQRAPVVPAGDAGSVPPPPPPPPAPDAEAPPRRLGTPPPPPPPPLDAARPLSRDRAADPVPDTAPAPTAELPDLEATEPGGPPLPRTGIAPPGAEPTAAPEATPATVPAVAPPEGPADVSPPAPVDDRPRATGSPDAPAPAPPADADRVPALIGLSLTDAEFRTRSADMALHVERVAGQPVGTVLAQRPDPGAARPRGGVVVVTVAAGGDHLGDLAPAPLVEVQEMAVPDLMDVTGPQAERILSDMGFVPVMETAVRGPPGRVADQLPSAGSVRPKGSKVVVRVAPARKPPPEATPRPESAPPQPPPRPEPRLAPAPGPTPVPAPARPEPRSGPPPALPRPTPLAPASGTALGADRELAVGFTWRPVPGASAYLVEVEERGPEGWLPNARKVARASAVVLEIERVVAPPGPLRWRVRAVHGGCHGAPCRWVVLQ